MLTRVDRKGIEILVIDADPTVQGGLKSLLTDQGFVVTATGNVTEALELVQVKYFAVALCDLDTPTSEAGLKVVQSIRESSPATTTLVLSPRKAYDAAVAAHRAGA